MILVLSGNKKEFEKFLENHEPKNIFRYISKEADYDGHANCDLVRVGSYENNPLWKDIDKRKGLNKYCRSHGIDINDSYLRK
ncbi:MAG: hypothetical protein ABIG46_04270 [Candidatus Omnitrophota bacterium]|nr:hypothetical protein [Patescibacteria group bacterium]